MLIIVGPNNSAVYGYSSQKPSHSLLRRVVFILVGAIILVVGGVIALDATTTSDKEVAQNFAKYVQAKDADRSYAMTSKSFQVVTNKESWIKTVNRIASSISGDLSPTTTGNSKDVYAFRTKNGLYLLTVGVVKEDGKTKVNFFNSSLAQK